MPNKRAVGAGLLLEDVERHAADHAPLQTRDEGRLVIDAAAGAVDQPHAGLEQFELRHADQVSRFVGQRRVDGEIVDVRQHVPHALAEFDAQLGGPVGRQERVEAEHPHVEGPGPAATAWPIRPKPDDAQRLAGQLGRP